MPNINYCSLEEVWGNNNIKEDMENYNNTKKDIHKTQLKAYDESQELFDSSDYKEIVEMYNNDEKKDEKKDENALTSIIEKFSTLSDDENNNDLILLVILGIFIIFVMDSLVKLKVSF
jgi:hypothetical protein|tara:strand:+ start:2036 stop:2389 length:354 start_codon:yes stop_codon:yes gene_type:complete